MDLYQYDLIQNEYGSAWDTGAPHNAMQNGRRYWHEATPLDNNNTSKLIMNDNISQKNINNEYHDENKNKFDN